jgi:two-component sensor histidine kinase
MELVSNAYKHGGRRVSLDFVADDGVARFSVKDNGPGFPIGFGENLAASTGLDLVDNLSRWDLAGKVAFENSNEGGGQVVIVFPISPLT